MHNKTVKIINQPKWFMGIPEYETKSATKDSWFKLSMYTHLFPLNLHEAEDHGTYTHEKATYVLFNAFNQATFLLPENYADEVKMLFNHHHFNSITIDKKIFQLLLDGRFIVPDFIDEKKLVKDRIKRGRQRNDMLYLTIAPTLGCNFNCTYCIEDESFRKDFKGMPLEVEDGIVQLAEHHILKSGIKHLTVAWFGGEPLIKINSIDRISERLMALCEKHKITFDTNITTNGFLLNDKAIDILTRYHTNFVKISLDGPPDIHNKRRTLLSGKPTYSKILDNIMKASQKMPVTIRVNIDQSNYESLMELLDLVAARKTPLHNITMYLGIVEENEFITDKFKTYLSRKLFAETELKFINEARKRKMSSWHLPSMIGNFCGADMDLAYMIGPSGELYQCWAEFGDPSKVVGYLNSPLSINEEHQLHYTEFDVTEHEKCSDCKVMPLCTGGCSRERLFHKEPQCGVYKFNLADRISEFIHQSKQIKVPGVWSFSDT
ncbi:radical SAM protein [Chryseobacterium sp. Tr-659]|uniref:radical SAM/SPASM domain-containing protein n=1 Tax=Chryseobacterium sp. Tr-659 TaxID=2608340 RepID=UPI0014207EF5|nr:radical SAM protein [Chryseobacterium sp. Tr-659]NIF05923.1 radical SAM protein [Chryseobacterium sp. Tr-659]